MSGAGLYRVNGDPSVTYVERGKIPKLTPTNHDSWKIKMEMQLIRECHLVIVWCRNHRPFDSGDTPTSKQSLWDEEAEKATASIFLYLSDEVLYMV